MLKWKRFNESVDNKKIILDLILSNGYHYHSSIFSRGDVTVEVNDGSTYVTKVGCGTEVQVNHRLKDVKGMIVKYMESLEPEGTSNDVMQFVYEKGFMKVADTYRTEGIPHSVIELWDEFVIIYHSNSYEKYKVDISKLDEIKNHISMIGKGYED